VSARRFGALVVDFGGVLTKPLREAMIGFCEKTGIELQDLARAALSVYYGGEDDLVVAFETGRISEEEFSNAFARRLTDVTGVEIDHEGLVGRMFAGIELETPMLTAVEVARRAGLKTGLLSNSWGADLYPRDVLDGLFDAVVISGEVGMRKPDPAIFALVVERLAVPASSCVFVDDHSDHLKTAQEIGMTTVLHNSPEETISQLEALLDLELH
jgi:putative hydrolase of the HAD superfamily